MNVLIAALLFLPGIVLSGIVWRKLSRPKASLHYATVAVATAVYCFFSVQFVVLFALAPLGATATCAELDECHFQIPQALQWGLLGVGCLFGILTYIGLRYC